MTSGRSREMAYSWHTLGILLAVSVCPVLQHFASALGTSDPCSLLSTCRGGRDNLPAVRTTTQIIQSYLPDLNEEPATCVPSV
jgi:hypothetical protein